MKDEAEGIFHPSSFILAFRALVQPRLDGVRRAVTETNSTCPSLFAFATTEHDRGALRH
jgi:hypothetical protein